MEKLNPKTADWINLVLGVLLFISPWIMGFAAHPSASWNAWIGGVIAAGLALVALARFAEWEEWLSVALGVWLIVSPWILNFSTNPEALWTTLIAGLLIGAFAAWHGIIAHRGGTQAHA